MNPTSSKTKMKTIRLNKLIECDHCEFVTHCELKGPQESTCPHSSTFEPEEDSFQEVDFSDRRFKEIKLIKMPTKEQEVILQITAGDLRTLEYGAYQLEISLEKYLKTILNIEVRKIRRDYKI